MPNLTPNRFNRLLEIGASHINRRVLAREFACQKPQKVNERPVEYSYLLSQLALRSAHRVLDVGSGTTALPATLRDCGYHVTATDNIRDYWVGGMQNRHYHITDDNIAESCLDSTFDFITCISVIEHIHDHDSAISHLFKLLAPGGSLVLTFPYNESRFVENVYAMPEAGYGKDEAYICRVYSRKEIENWLKAGAWHVSDQEYWQVFHGPLWTMGGRLESPKKVSASELHHLTCVTLTKNGDLE